MKYMLKITAISIKDKQNFSIIYTLVPKLREVWQILTYLVYILLTIKI